MFRDLKFGVEGKFRSGGSVRPQSTTLRDIPACPAAFAVSFLSFRNHYRLFQVPKARAPTEVSPVQIPREVCSNRKVNYARAVWHRDCDRR